MENENNLTIDSDGTVVVSEGSKNLHGCTFINSTIEIAGMKMGMAEFMTKYNGEFPMEEE